MKCDVAVINWGEGLISLYQLTVQGSELIETIEFEPEAFGFPVSSAEVCEQLGIDVLHEEWY